MYNLISPVRHGLFLAVTALICGVSWAGYLATQHERLHGGFEKQEAALKAKEMQRPRDMRGLPSGTLAKVSIPEAHTHGNESHEEEHKHEDQGGDQHGAHQHSHSGSLAKDAMERLMRGHIHWMGLGILSSALLLIVAFTSLKTGWKKTLGWTFGIGALAYPVSWILMGFRTVTMGPEVAEASVMWLFGPAAGLLLASLIAVLGVLLLEMTGWHESAIFSRFFEPVSVSEELE